MQFTDQMHTYIYNHTLCICYDIYIVMLIKWGTLVSYVIIYGST